MGYCRPRWISDYTYEAVIPRLRRDSQVWDWNHERVQNSLLVWGEISAEGEITLDPSVEMPMRPARPDDRGSSTVQGFDENGSLLFSYRFDPEIVPHLEGTGHFVFALPLSEIGGRQPETVRVESAGRVAERRSRIPREARPEGHVRRQSVARGEEFSWNVADHPMAVMRDRRTGRILSFSRSGRVVFPAADAADVEVILSDGVRSHIVPATEVRR